MTPKGNFMPHKKPPIMVPNVPDDSDSDPSSSDSSLSDSSESSDNGYNKRVVFSKKNKNKCRSKIVLTTLSRSAQILHLSYLRMHII